MKTKLIKDKNLRRGDCPKTQTSDLNVEVNNQFAIELKKDEESEDSLAIHSKPKVDDVNYAELVFGQSVGERNGEVL